MRTATWAAYLLSLAGLAWWTFTVMDSVILYTLLALAAWPLARAIDNE